MEVPANLHEQASQLYEQAQREVAAGDSGAAESHYRQALALDPLLAAAHNGLGIFLFGQDRHDEALASFQAAARLAPNLVEVQFNLGTCLYAKKQLAEAAEALERCVALDPRLAMGQHNLAIPLFDLEQYAAAVAREDAALALAPEMFEAHVGRGMALQQLEQFPDAIAAYRRALALAPNSVVAHYNLGTALQKQADLAAAEAQYRAALAIDPGYVGAYVGLSNVFQKRGEFRAAIASLKQALRYDPGHIEAHVNCGTLLMMHGDFEAGLAHHEWRLKNAYAERDYSYEKWTGEPLGGKKILVHTEWGFGDTFQFVRYLPLIRERGGDVTLEVHPALFPLLAASGYDSLVSNDSPAQAKDYDAQVPIMSLPLVFGHTIDTIPAPIPYLKADPALAARWRQRLSIYPGCKIGLHWRGAERWGSDVRAMPLAALAPLARTPGITLFSLQKNEGRDELDAMGDELKIVNFGDELDATHGAFMDTAAIITNLDLVITTDTSIPHLAGALGARVWLLLRQQADWRWFLDRRDSPWYPTMRLFRQRQADLWTDVVEQMTAELADWLASGPGSGND